MKLEMFRGDTPTWPVACHQADGSVLPVTSGSLSFTAKSSTRQSDVDAVFQKTIGDGITLVDAANGIISITLDSSDTSSLYAPTILQWDLQYVTTGNIVSTLSRGTLLVKDDVTSSIS